ncbi:MAG: AgmX/PglI C-terminal domain-containing protein [Pseudomonadota bacterium]
MAAQATGKILRIGVIQSGKIIEERLLRKRDVVTIGTDTKNTFVFPASELPKAIRLFDFKGGAYTLCFDDKMDGRVSVGESVLDFTGLKTQGVAKKSGDQYRVSLNEESRGKVVVGGFTLLFQFVVPPPEPAKPQLPSVAKGGWVKSIDWFFTALIACSFVAHTGFLVSFKFTDLPPNPTVFELPDRFAKFVVPDKKKRDLEDAKKAGEGKTDDEKKKKAKKKADDDEGDKKAGKKKEMSESEKAAAAAARKAAIQQKVAGKGLLKILGARGPGADGSGAISDVFSDGGLSGDLDGAFDGTSGVGIANSADETTRRGSGSGEATGIGDLATEGVGTANTGSKGAVSVRGNIQASAVESVDGSLDPKKIAAAIRSRLSGIKNCYEQQLKRNPKLAGKIVVAFVIDETGKVSEASVDSDTLGDGQVAKCIIGLIRRVRFPKPDEGTVEATFPFVFTPAG